MPKGMSRAQIDQLPTYRWSSAVEKEAHACVVCMYDVQPRQTVRALPCNHVYHARCIDKWLKTNRTCPVCRQDASKYSETKHELVASAISGPSTSSTQMWFVLAVCVCSDISLITCDSHPLPQTMIPSIVYDDYLAGFITSDSDHCYHWCYICVFHLVLLLCDFSLVCFGKYLFRILIWKYLTVRFC